MLHGDEFLEAYWDRGRVDEVRHYVGTAAGDIATTCHLRETTDLRSRKVEIRALLSVVYGQEIAEEFFEEPEDWVLVIEEDDFIESLAAISRDLPFSREEVMLLRTEREQWDREEGKWQMRPSPPVRSLIRRWFRWLRDPPDEETEIEFISAGATKLHRDFVILHDRFRHGRDMSVY